MSLRPLDVRRLATLTSMVLGGLASPTAGQDELLVCGSFSNSVLVYDGRSGGFDHVLVPSGSGGLFVVTAMDVAPDGDLYVCSRGNGKILRFDGESGALRGELGVVFSAMDLCFGPDGQLYVCRSSPPSVLRFDVTAGGPPEVFVPDGSGHLFTPVRLQFGSDGNLYVASSAYDAVFRYEGQTGAFLDLFVTPGDGGTDGVMGMAFGPGGNLYLSSMRTHSVHEYDRRTGHFLRVVVDASSEGAPFLPHNLVIDGRGVLHLADYGRDAVQRYDVTDGRYLGPYVTSGSGGLDGTEDLVLRHPGPRLGLVVRKAGVDSGPLTPGAGPPAVSVSSHRGLPGELVRFAGSLRNAPLGVPLPGCEPLTMFLGPTPTLLGQADSDVGGLARIELPVPARLSGTTVFLQALAPASCRVSEVVRFTIP